MGVGKHARSVKNDQIPTMCEAKQLIKVVVAAAFANT